MTKWKCQVPFLDIMSWHRSLQLYVYQVTILLYSSFFLYLDTIHDLDNILFHPPMIEYDLRWTLRSKRYSASPNCGPRSFALIPAAVLVRIVASLLRALCKCRLLLWSAMRGRRPIGLLLSSRCVHYAVLAMGRRPRTVSYLQRKRRRILYFA